MKKTFLKIGMAMGMTTILICFVVVGYFVYITNLPSPEIFPPGFDQTGCDRPCWYGLQAGISTKEDVKTVLKALPPDYMDIHHYEGVRDNKYFFQILFMYHESDMVFRFTFANNDNYLDYMDFGNDVSPDNILGLFGDPDVAIAHMYSRQGITDRVGGTVFFYIDKGIFICRGQCINYWRGHGYVGFYNPSLYTTILAELFGDADLALQYASPYQGLDAEYPVLEGE